MSSTMPPALPDWVPPRVACSLSALDEPQCGTAVPGLTVAKHGVVELEMLPDGPGERYSRTPLSLGRILRIDPADSSTQSVYLRATGGGLAQGDSQRLHIRVRDRAHFLLTTQAASRVHSMDNGYALHEVQVAVDDSGVFEYLPDPVIASRHSRYLQQTVIRCAPEATVIAGDAFSAGRIAMGEIHRADVMFVRTELRRAEGPIALDTPIFIEQALYDSHESFTSPLTHHHYNAWASLWLLCPNHDKVKEVLNAWQEYPNTPGLVVGASTFTGQTGCWVRFLGDSMETVLTTRHQYWDRARRLALGKPAFELRKM